jgi:phosphoribosylglycinamide formyltransferase-1
LNKINSQKIKVAVLISGRGSNMQALIEACKNSDYPAQIALVIANKADAYGLEIAQQNNIKTAFLDHKKFASRQEFDAKLSEIIEENNCDIICLAGFMRLLSEKFVNHWAGKLINIHPSLLPAFKGANAVGDALDYGVKYTGCTVHFVTQEMDSGPIIAQAVVEINEGDTKEILASRILQKEHIIYAQALKKICQNMEKK